MTNFFAGGEFFCGLFFYRRLIFTDEFFIDNFFLQTKTLSISKKIYKNLK